MKEVECMSNQESNITPSTVKFKDVPVGGYLTPAHTDNRYVKIDHNTAVFLGNPFVNATGRIGLQGAFDPDESVYMLAGQK